MLDLSDLCRSWKLSPILAAWLPESGTIHYTLLLKTAEGNYALRAYRYTAAERWRIVNEHAVVSYIQAQGFPTLAPLLLDLSSLLCIVIMC